MSTKLKTKSKSTSPHIRCYLKHLQSGAVHAVLVPKSQLRLDETEAEYVAEVVVYGDPRTVRVRVYVDDDQNVTRAYFLQRGDITRGELVPRADYVEYNNRFLRIVLDYTDADMNANQSGKLTEQQQMQLRMHAEEMLLGHLGLSLLIFVVVVFPLTAVDGVVFFFSALILAGYALRTMLRFQSWMRASRRDKVHVYSGQVHYILRPPFSNRRRIHVGEGVFNDTIQRTRQAFIPGERYHVYAVRDYPIMLSAEMDPEPPPHTAGTLEAL